jgi:hypothetical protein
LPRVPGVRNPRFLASPTQPLTVEVSCLSFSAIHGMGRPGFLAHGIQIHERDLAIVLVVERRATSPRPGWLRTRFGLRRNPPPLRPLSSSGSRDGSAALIPSASAGIASPSTAIHSRRSGALHNVVFVMRRGRVVREDRGLAPRTPLQSQGLHTRTVVSARRSAEERRRSRDRSALRWCRLTSCDRHLGPGSTRRPRLGWDDQGGWTRQYSTSSPWLGQPGNERWRNSGGGGHVRFGSRTCLRRLRIPQFVWFSPSVTPSLRAISAT